MFTFNVKRGNASLHLLDPAKEKKSSGSLSKGGVAIGISCVVVVFTLACLVMSFVVAYPGESGVGMHPYGTYYVSDKMYAPYEREESTAIGFGMIAFKLLQFLTNDDMT